MIARYYRVSVGRKRRAYYRIVIWIGRDTGHAIRFHHRDEFGVQIDKLVNRKQ